LSYRPRIMCRCCNRLPVKKRKMINNLQRGFRSLKGKGFAILWGSDLAVSSAEFLELFILSWYVLQKTESPTILGIYAALRFTGTLFAPLLGVLVDHFGLRRSFNLSRSIFFILSFILAAIFLLEEPSILVILFMSALLGVMRSTDLITRQSVLTHMVSQGELQNAVALSRMGRDLTQIIVPIAAGFLLSSLGTEVTYLGVVILYALSVVLSLMIPKFPRIMFDTKSNMWGFFTEGLSYIKSYPFLIALLLIAFIVNLTAFPLNHALLAVISNSMFDTDATGFGIIMGGYSAGALLGSLWISYFSEMRRPSRLMVFGCIFWHVAIFSIAFSTYFYVSVSIVLLAGIFQSFSMVIMAMLILRYTSEDMRSRVLGVRQLAVYGLPLGLVISGFVSENFDVVAALIGNAVVGLLLLAFVLITWPRPLLHN
jgi:MFS family permease